MRKIYSVFLLVFLAVSLLKAQNVGIGTATPTDKLHINSATGANPLLVQVNAVNKLRVNANGGTSIGSAAAAPANGLYVAGVTNPFGGIRSATNPISIQSNNDSVEIIAGQNKIVVAANGGIRIITGGGTNGITIDAGNGDLNLKGKNINITATNTCTTKANKLFSTSTDSTYFSTINGNIALHAAKNTDITSALSLTVTTGVSSIITTGAAMSITTGANMDITNGGTTSITSGKKLSIAVDDNMDLSVSKSFVTTTGLAMSATAGTGYSVNAAADLSLKSSTVSRLNGNLVILNNGTKPAARATDPTLTLYTNGVGTITAGSTTVLIGN